MVSIYLLNLILIIIIVVSIYIQREQFIESDISQNILTPDAMKSIVNKNQNIFYSPCEIVTGDGSRYRFQAVDKLLNWYAVPGKTNTCTVDMSSDELEPTVASCSTTNKVLYDPSVVQSINWDDTAETGKGCVITVKPNVSSAQLDDYIQRLPSYKKILGDSTSFVNAFTQTIQFIPVPKVYKIDIPKEFHSQLFRQQKENIARSVCFWVKLWTVSPDWRLLGSIGDGEWNERKPAIYMSPNDTWVHFTVNNDTSWQTTYNGGIRIGYDNAFVCCRVYKDVKTQQYKLSSRVVKVDNNGNETIEQQSTTISKYPILTEELDPRGTKIMKFGNGGNGGFAIWDWRIYPKALSDSDVNQIKELGKSKLGYTSINGQRMPMYFIAHAHMNQSYTNANAETKRTLILHRAPANQRFDDTANESFVQKCESKTIKYICVPREPDRIYRIDGLNRNVYGYWSMIYLTDVDNNGNPSGREISTKMLFNPDTKATGQDEYIKVIIGLTDLPVNFANGKWLSDIYPSISP
jgi:hypothetical protein